MYLKKKHIDLSYRGLYCTEKKEEAFKEKFLISAEVTWISVTHKKYPKTAMQETCWERVLDWLCCSVSKKIYFFNITFKDNGNVYKRHKLKSTSQFPFILFIILSFHFILIYFHKYYFLFFWTNSDEVVFLNQSLFL